MNNERTRLFIAMALAAVILFGWNPLIHFIEDKTGYALLPKPAEPATQPADTAPVPPEQPPATTGPSTQTPTTGAAAPPPGQIGIAAPPAGHATDMQVVIGSSAWQDKTYAMALHVDVTSGGLSRVDLNNYPQSIGENTAFQYQLPYDTAAQPMSTRSVTVNGTTRTPVGTGWYVAAKSENAVTLAIDFVDSNGPLLTIQKTFEVEPRDAGGGNGAQGFDTKFVLQYVNRSTRPLVVSSVLTGPTFLPSEQMRGGDRSVVAGYAGKNDVLMRHDALESFTGTGATKDYTSYEGQPLLWIGSGGNYFNAIVRPVGDWLKAASAAEYNKAEPDEAAQRKVAISLTSKDVGLAPGGVAVNEARVYFGPRKRDILKNPYYAAANIGYEHTLETSGSCAYCTFQWLVDFLMMLLGAFHAVLRDWGLSIIALVFVVRTCLHPITKRSQINMAKMSKMGPKIQEIKDRFGNDKEAMNRAMMDFYKTQGATPVLGCLPMFLQMPIWIALYSGLGSTFELRQAPFLKFFGHNLTWIHDLSKPDHLLQFSEPFNFLVLHIDGLNVIPFLLAGAFFLQQKFTPKPVATTPEQQQQQKMMQWMTLLFPLMLYSSPSGLNLYILTSTIFGIIESRIIRKHIAEREALATAGPTFIDGDVVDRDDADRGPKARAAAVQPADGLMGRMQAWWQDKQEQIEKMRADAEKQARNKRR